MSETVSKPYRYPRSRGPVEPDGKWLEFSAGMFGLSQIFYYRARTKWAHYNPHDIDGQVMRYMRWRSPGYICILVSLGGILKYYLGSQFTLDTRCKEFLRPFVAQARLHVPWLPEVFDEPAADVSPAAGDDEPLPKECM
eukprot:TRINITY_DN47625_c0_g1_i1.p2 TRINITY_DN47625_c0_g1~~TRINITY_DN47625_c0_g1_i1.p2  ORF type:complete len:139 (-),score=13.42 TRINITY_DN47625_c0_g1_i1:249-665(-)